MKATPYLSFVEEEEEFQRNPKSLLDYSCSLLLDNNNTTTLNWIPAASINKARGGGVFFHVGASDTNKTTATASPSPSPVAAAASSTTSTLSSSLNSGGAGGGGCSPPTTQDIADPKSSCEWGTSASLPAESVVGPASPGQEQSILRLIMGDIEDPSAGLSKLLQGGGGGGGGGSSHHDMEFAGGGFSLMDHQIQGGLSFERQVNPFSSLFQTADSAASSVNVMSSFVPPPHSLPIHHQSQQQQQQMIMNQNQTQFLQNPSFFGFNDPPLSPPQKRINLGSNYVLPSSVVVMKQQQQQQQNDGHQQSIIDQLYKTVELIETGNAVLAQEILARLNHQLSPIGKPFYKAAFYFKEALNSSILLHTAPQPPPFSPFSVIYKIGAYKSFCEISPIVQFANFTCNQAFLEAFQGCNRVHILSFDVGFGGEWASLMQELALRNGGPPSLKITAFAAASPSAANDDLELGLTEENLKHFAWELNIALEFEVVNINCFSSPNFQLPTINGSSCGGEEAIAVNFPISAFANYPSYLPRALRFLKQLSPKIVVCLDRGGCDRIDTPFPNHMIHALQSYTTLIESLEAVNSNSDALHKIERYLIQPGIEKIVSGRCSSAEKPMSTTLLAWRSLFVSSGFSPLTFSNFNESQAECLVQRNLVRGFHVEKRQSALVLCWNRKELISASAWTA